ncbi:hypothetical protein ACJMK2_032305 [Sinanodonta woodiana]|uniref:THAP-type domain-containing protein n=1 Tax=Sinanodonta woodiana TaxID=1069815 RepID=A0ABD3X5D7_SINWO
MPAHCCCVGCNSRQQKGCETKFFRIPKDDMLRNKWIAALRRENWLPTDHTRICSKHFIKGCSSRDSGDPDFVPTIFSYTPVGKKNDYVLQAKVQWHQRLVERDYAKQKTIAAKALLSLRTFEESNVSGTSTQTDRCMCHTSTQTDIDVSLMQLILAINRQFKVQLDTLQKEKDVLLNDLAAHLHELNDVQCKNVELTKKLKAADDKNAILMKSFEQKSIEFKNMQDNDKKIKFYTGLPNSDTFLSLFEETCTHAKRHKTKLKHKDELLMTLIKLRRNLAMEDLAYRYDTTVSQVTKIFHRWLQALYIAVGGLVMWPESDEMELTEVFQNDSLRKVRCIIDCTEIFIERPSILKARAQTYFNYKRHNTVKVLVAISPTGAVIFLSPCWGGRVSDREITLKSGLLEKLLPGDTVLADRGFTMEEEFSFRGAKLMIPAFTKRRKQLSAKEVEESRFMSRARIHVERVIGRIKDFEILQGTLPLTLTKRPSCNTETTCDKILTVIGAIVNMNDPIL